MKISQISKSVSLTNILGLFIFINLAFSLNAQQVTNGSVTGAPAGNDHISYGYAAGWTVGNATPDLCNVTFPSWFGSSNVSCVASPNGGTWLGLASYNEIARTTITGLTIGATYTLSFYGANFGDGAFVTTSTPANPIISVVGCGSLTPTIPLVANTWTLYSFNFTATATNHVLRCRLPLSSNTTYVSLDGFAVTLATNLPIELTDFHASCFKNYRKIYWTTASEDNNAYFTLEKSTDGIHFEVFKKIDSQSQGGSQDYEVLDDDLFSGTIYYRLSQTDFNGASKMFDMIASDCSGIMNPMQIEALDIIGNTLHVMYNANKRQNHQLEIYDYVGRLILSKELFPDKGLNSEDIVLDDLSSGIYTLKISSGDNQAVRRFYKQ